MIYKGTFSETTSGRVFTHKTFFFSIGHKYIFSVSKNSVGAALESTQSERILYHKKQFENYVYKKSSMEEVSKEHLTTLIKWIFTGLKI